MPQNGIAWTIRPLDTTDAVNKFEIERENDALRAFLKKSAANFHSNNIAKTYVAVENTSNRIRSYVSILLSEIKKEYANIEDCPEASRYNYPAIKIARLATDRNYEGRGIGSDLISFVAGLSITQVMPFAGCRFLILDANRAKVDFYKNRGFVMVENDENLASPNPVMFMDLHKTKLKLDAANVG